MIRIVHILNQFFAGIGGEEKADMAVAVADALRDRHRLAGNRRLIDLGLAFDHVTVGWHPVAWTNHDNVAYAHALNAHLPDLAGLFDPSGARHEIDQSLDARPRTPRCNGFQKFTDREQEYDDRCLFGCADRERASVWLGLLVGATIAAAVGLLTGFPALRLRGHYLALVTLGLAEIIRLVATNWLALTGGAACSAGAVGCASAGAAHSKSADARIKLRMNSPVAGWLFISRRRQRRTKLGGAVRFQQRA